MNRWGRIVLAVGALAVAVVLFVVLRPSGDDEEAEPAAQTTTEAETTTEEAPATTEAATTEEAETTTEEAETTTEEAGPPPRQRVVVVVRDAAPVGGIVRAQVDEGARVVLIVRSDVADEVHLHGYDLSAEVGPGEPARIQFRANVPGRFEVELEERGVEIAEIEVS